MLAAFALFTAGSMSAATTFATFLPYEGSTLQWGACAPGSPCTISVNFNYVGSVASQNYAPYNGTLVGTLTYDWAPVGTAGGFTIGSTSYYGQDVVGDFVFTFAAPGGTENLLTVDFGSVNGQLFYNGGSHDLQLNLTPGTSGSAPIVSSTIVKFPGGGLTDWAFSIDFGNLNPGWTVEGNINSFSGAFNGAVGSSPLPGGQVPEPTSMLMAGAGLLAVSGLLRLKKRFHK